MSESTTRKEAQDDAAYAAAPSDAVFDRVAVQDGGADAWGDGAAGGVAGCQPACGSSSDPTVAAIEWSPDTRPKRRLARRLRRIFCPLLSVRKLLHRLVAGRRLLQPKQRRLQALAATLLDQPAHVHKRVLALPPRRQPRRLPSTKPSSRSRTSTADTSTATAVSISSSSNDDRTRKPFEAKPQDPLPS